jgi:hypothetical protein
MNNYVYSDASTEYKHVFVAPNEIEHVRSACIKALFPSSDGTLDTIEMNDLNTLLLPIQANKILTGAKLNGIATKAHLFVSAEQRAYYPSTEHIVIKDSGNVTTTKPKKLKELSKMVITKTQTTTSKKRPINIDTSQRSIMSFLLRQSTSSIPSDTSFQSPSINTVVVESELKSTSLEVPDIEQKVLMLVDQPYENDVVKDIVDYDDQISHEELHIPTNMVIDEVAVKNVVDYQGFELVDEVFDIPYIMVVNKILEEVVVEMFFEQWHADMIWDIKKLRKHSNIHMQ